MDKYALFSFSTMIAILNPMGVLPLFLPLVKDLKKDEVLHVALRGGACALMVLIAAAFWGPWLFRVLEIPLSAFKTAGGILLFLFSLQMIQVQPPRARSTPEEREEGIEKDDMAVFPVAIPMIAGPGSLATALILGQSAETASHKFWLLGAITVAVVIVTTVLSQAPRISEVLGRIGINVLTRLTGLLLMAMAVKLVMSGIHEGVLELSYAK